jgi:dihydrofolate reductase
MELIIIAAVAENNVIGKDGKIPWHIKEDFEHFKQLTLGHPCVMGDVTYDSLPPGARPLPGRENIVLTLKKDFRAPGAKVFNSWDEAMQYLHGKQKVFICGGASIYRLGMKHASVLELTRVHQSPEGDTFFPDVNWDEWKLVSEEKHEGYTFQRYEK